ncbi:MAG: GAF domain-containing protein [Chloroflexi bacterium]|nr:GAF domain-containing protein [Chloroflexota bacterium]
MNRIASYIYEIRDSLESLPLGDIDQVVTILHEARLFKRRVFVMGNGGCAAIATRFANDLRRETRQANWPNFRATGLAENAAVISGYANEEGFDNVFALPLEDELVRGDVVIGFCVTGGSRNIIKAMELANRRGATTIAITGGDGGRLGSLADIHVNVPVYASAQVEDFQWVMAHLITRVLREEARRATPPGQKDLAAGVTAAARSKAEPARPAENDAAPLSAERRKESLEVFSELSSELASELELKELLRRVLQISLKKVSAKSGSIVVLNEKGEAVESALAYNGDLLAAASQDLNDIIERGLVSWVVQNRQPALINNTRNDPRWLPRLWEDADSRERSAISVPLINDERVVGVMTLATPHAYGFTHEDLSFLAAVAVFVSAIQVE